MRKMGTNSIENPKPLQTPDLTQATIISQTKCGLRSGQYYRVKKEVDGDTFWLDDGCEGVKIRLIGIDAPECKNHFGKTKEEAFGKEANVYISSLLSDQLVRPEFDVDSLDQYGRTLAYCYTSDGTFINLKMIEEGFAKAYTVLPNNKYEDLFEQVQRIAQENKKNIWHK